MTQKENDKVSSLSDEENVTIPFYLVHFNTLFNFKNEENTFSIIMVHNLNSYIRLSWVYSNVCLKISVFVRSN